MQYIRRRIQRVSGVTVRDERIESRDFPAKPLREELGGAPSPMNGRVLSRAEVRALHRIGAAHRQRT